MAEKMRASEALLLGSTLLKPRCGIFENNYNEGCALGMINKAVGGGTTTSSEGFVKFQVVYPWLDFLTHNSKPLPCSCTGDILMGGGGQPQTKEVTEASVAARVVHLFNYHVCTLRDWTIEKLAEYVDSQDPTPRELPFPAEAPQRETVCV